MKIILICLTIGIYLLVAIAIYVVFFPSLEDKTEVLLPVPAVGPVLPLIEVDKLIKEKYNDYEMWGYYNGLVMATRVLGENQWFKKMGFDEYDPNMTCESVIENLWDLASKRLMRPD